MCSTIVTYSFKIEYKKVLLTEYKIHGGGCSLLMQSLSTLLNSIHRNNHHNKSSTVSYYNRMVSSFQKSRSIQQRRRGSIIALYTIALCVLLYSMSIFHHQTTASTVELTKMPGATVQEGQLRSIQSLITIRVLLRHHSYLSLLVRYDITCLLLQNFHN